MLVLFLSQKIKESISQKYELRSILNLIIDTAYTERFMGTATEEDNSNGYDVSRKNNQHILS